MLFGWIYIGALVLMVAGLVIGKLLRDSKKKSDPKDDSNDHLNNQHFDAH